MQQVTRPDFFDNPYAASQASMDESTVAGAGQEMAGRGMRWLATIIDTVLMYGGLAIIFYPWLSKEASLESDAVKFGLLSFAWLILWWGGNCWLIYRNGQTVGKKICRIRVVREDGSRCSLARYVFMRALPIGVVRWIPYLGGLAAFIDAVMIFRGNYRCAHDDMAGTIVVKA
ncbi:RDD family protein [Andreprevotia lacus]|uniref:RDD family protein n=1 Tax=Andreprevotia lacus TaxID=1121000 RepID=UPI0015940474|nr:RDD family protein [Andreprevotia lacus]